MAGKQVPRSRPLRLSFPGAGTLSLNEEWYALVEVSPRTCTCSGAGDRGHGGRPYQRPAVPRDLCEDGTTKGPRLLQPPSVTGKTSGRIPRSKSWCSAASAWALRNIDADVTPNVEQVHAGQQHEELTIATRDAWGGAWLFRRRPPGRRGAIASKHLKWRREIV